MNPEKKDAESAITRTTNRLSAFAYAIKANQKTVWSMVLTAAAIQLGGYNLPPTVPSDITKNLQAKPYEPPRMRFRLPHCYTDGAGMHCMVENNFPILDKNSKPSI